MAERAYRVFLEAEAEGGFHAFIPDLPGLHTHGQTREEALAHAKEAAELYV